MNTLNFCMGHTTVGQLQEWEFVLYSKTFVILMTSCRMWCIRVALLALSRNKGNIQTMCVRLCRLFDNAWIVHSPWNTSGESLSCASSRLACSSQSILSQVFFNLGHAGKGSALQLNLGKKSSSFRRITSLEVYDCGIAETFLQPITTGLMIWLGTDAAQGSSVGNWRIEML